MEKFSCFSSRSALNKCVLIETQKEMKKDMKKDILWNNLSHFAPVWSKSEKKFFYKSYVVSMKYSVCLDQENLSDNTVLIYI